VPGTTGTHLQLVGWHTKKLLFFAGAMLAGSERLSQETGWEEHL